MITIYSGLMSSGKTEHLLRDYFEIKNNKNNKVLLVKSDIDRDKLHVKSRTGLKALSDLSLPYDGLEILYDKIKDNKYTHVFIDEIQFFDKTILNIIENNKNVNFYISGLEKDSNENKFGYLLDIKSLPNVKIKHFTMFCQYCKHAIAETVFKKVKNNNQVFVGDKEFISVCYNCNSYLRKYFFY